MTNSNQIDLILKDISSFEIFFKKNYHVACLVALKYLPDQQQAEDIVQETFIYIWQKRNELNIRTNFKAYLFTAVRNRCLNFVRREQKLEEISEDMPEIEGDFNFSDEELSVKIAQSIESLPPQCKKIFLLAYKENLTYNEIADTLDLSKNTIKTQMGIAYKILRENLKSYLSILIILPMKKLARSL